MIKANYAHIASLITITVQGTKVAVVRESHKLFLSLTGEFA
jgi:hypothetical protein